MTATIITATVHTATYYLALLMWVGRFFQQMFLLTTAFHLELVPVPVHPVAQRERSMIWD